MHIKRCILLCNRSTKEYVMANSNVTIRLDSELKKMGESLFDDLGLSMTAAITAFIKQAVREQCIPFKLTRDVSKTPNVATLRAIREIEKMEKNPSKYKSYSSAKEMLESCL